MMHGVDLRNAQREIHRFRSRLAVAAGFVLVMFGLLFARFVFLQVVQHDYYQTLAESNRISVVPIVPNRGLILDRNGQVLAHNYSAYTLEISPGKVDNLETLINDLTSVVEISPRDRKRFRKLLDESKGADSLPIRNRLSDVEVARFSVNRYRFPGVEIKARLFRQYPNGEMISHVVGYIGRINDKELERIQSGGLASNYRGTDHIGKVGIEQSYERQLHGTTGSEQVEIDAGGRAVRTLSRTPPVSGSNLTLTLDLKLQEIAFNAFGERRGALVAIEPGTGAVLAFVSKPGFDSNLFVDGIDPQSWSELNTSPDRPMTNRALAGTYPPGSTFKPFMALAALALGKRTPQQSISDPGFFNFGNHTFRDDKVGGHGSVDMYKSIVVSCDTYYYHLANDMGIDNISGFMRQLGLGSRTGIDLEHESPGILPSQEWKMRRFKQKWFAGETISVGIGQGYNSYTPLQLAQAMATLATGGSVYKPRLVSHIEDIRTRTKTPVEPEHVRTLALRPEHVEVIKQAMVGVNKEGTGARAFAGASYTSGGKTGTAQVVAIKQGEKYDEKRVQERHRDHALFIAYAPADRPRIALAIVVENAGFGARAAAPIARTVLDYYLTGKVPVPNNAGTREADTSADDND